MPRFDDRFARQDRCEPPPEFPLASPCPSIVHHLSGLSTNALAPRPLATNDCRGPTLRRRRCGRRITPRLPSLRHWGSSSPSTRARAQLLGPCFKTGLSECREPRGIDRGQPPSASRRRQRHAPRTAKQVAATSANARSDGTVPSRGREAAASDPRSADPLATMPACNTDVAHKARRAATLPTSL